MSALLDRDLPRLDGWPGLVLTEEEATAPDMAARMRFVADVDRELSDYLASEPLVGGAWFDQTMGGRFVVSLIADDSRVKETIRRLMPSESLGLQFRDARYGLAVLSDAVRRLDAVWASITRSPLPVSIGVNERENAVSVGVAENDWASLTQATAAELEKELGVPVVYHAEMDGADLSCANRDSCRGVQAGLMVRYHSPSSSKYCLSGFLIHKGSASPPCQLLTAGHCAMNVSGSTNTWEPFDDWWHGGSHIGDFKSHDLYVPYGIEVGRIGIDGGLSVIAERIFGESVPYSIVPQVGTWEGQPLCASLAVTDYKTSSDGVHCGIVKNTGTYWQSESGPWRVHGSAMNLSGSNGPISGDSGSPIYMRYESDSGSRRIPVGIVDHEFIPCGSLDPGAAYDHTNHCGRDLYFAEVDEVLAEWSSWAIWTGQ